VVIVATHDLDLAEGLLDEALFLRDGRVVETMARPEALRATYRAVMTRPAAAAARPSPGPGEADRPRPTSRT
jgi:ABC-type glutathione transport system ATPase component